MAAEIICFPFCPTRPEPSPLCSGEGSAVTEAQFAALGVLLGERFGCRGAGAEARVRLLATVRARMAQAGLADFWKFYARLHRAAGAEDLRELVDAVAETGSVFSTEDAQMQALRSVIVPALRASGACARGLRVASLGCGAGGEVWSLAAVLAGALSAEEWAAADMLALDVSGSALLEARRGCFAAAELAGVPAALRADFFEEKGEVATVRAELREHVVFGWHNLLEALPQTGFDVIFCRGVLGGFSVVQREGVLIECHAALNRGGWLVPGEGEAAEELHGCFHRESGAGAVCLRRAEIAA